jgi:hypothetical protein
MYYNIHHNRDPALGFPTSITIVTQHFWITIFLGLKMSLAGQQFHSNNNGAAG